MSITIERLIASGFKANDLQEFIKSTVIILSEEDELYKARQNAFEALELTRSINERNPLFISNKTRFDIERILVPFIEEADEELNKPVDYWEPPDGF